MADTNNNGETPQRSDSNLPILFANGYPTSLKNMKMESLELFLPFLAECVADAENVPPKWWPHDLQFKFPLERPRRFKNVSLYFIVYSEYILYDRFHKRKFGFLFFPEASFKLRCEALRSSRIA